METWYFLILDQEAQNIFDFQYSPNQEKLGDYPTKAHDECGTLHACPYYVHTKDPPRLLPRAPRPSTQQDCVGGIPNPYLCRTLLPLVRFIKDRMDQIQTGLE